MNEINRISRETMCMEFAHTAAKRGTCGRLAVGAIITVDGFHPVSIGYVGSPPGEKHCGDHCNLNKPCTQTIHAEDNAIRFALRRGINISGGYMFITDAPCTDCADRIIESGLRRVYFDRPYRMTDGVERLVNFGIEVYRVIANGYVMQFGLTYASRR